MEKIHIVQIGIKNSLSRSIVEEHLNCFKQRVENIQPQQWSIAESHERHILKPSNHPISLDIDEKTHDSNERLRTYKNILHQRFHPNHHL